MSPWRRVGVVLLVLLASAACVGLGLWQWNRHVDRAAQVDLIHANLGTATAPISDLLPTDDLDPDDVWRTVEVTGTWVPGSGVQLRNRPVQDANASHSLALLRLEDGRVLVVNRGWWRQTDVVPDGVLDPPAGEVTLDVRLRAAEELDDRANPAGEVYRVKPEAVLTQSGAQLDASDQLITTAYGMQVAPVPTGELGALPEPDTSLRSHLSYAFQWWFFAAAVPVAAIVIGRRSAEQDEENAHDGEGAPSARPTSRRRRPTMEEEEDAILDAQAEAARASAATSGSADPSAAAGKQADQASEISSA